MPPMLVAPQRKPTTTKLAIRNIDMFSSPDRPNKVRHFRKTSALCSTAYALWHIVAE